MSPSSFALGCDIDDLRNRHTPNVTRLVGCYFLTVLGWGILSGGIRSGDYVQVCGYVLHLLQLLCNLTSRNIRMHTNR